MSPWPSELMDLRNASHYVAVSSCKLFFFPVYSEYTEMLLLQNCTVLPHQAFAAEGRVGTGTLQCFQTAEKDVQIL